MVEPLSLGDNKTLVETHFGLHDMPFGVAPDPRFFFQNYHYTEALDVLADGIKAKKGLLVVTGEVGTGKTILLRKLMRHLEATTRFVFVSTSHVTSDGLIELIVEDLGLPTQGKTRFEIEQALKDYLLQQNREAKTVALLIDEAQKVTDGALESLCDLSNLETEQEKLLQIVLVGQPELIVKLRKPALQRIKQRIAIHYQTRALSLASEVEHYIRHRLRAAGYEGPEIFNQKALEAIWSYSSGTPRLINTLCDNALAMASRAGRKRVSAYVIVKVAAKLMLDRPADGRTNGASNNGIRSNGFARPTAREFGAHTSQATQQAAESLDTFINRRSNHVTAPVSAIKERTVASQFFDFMARAATEGIGPMAKLIVDDQIADLGESRDSFPQRKLAELIERVSREIFNDTMRARFLDKMEQAVSALQTMRSF
ncbi:MAG: peptidoglycan-binding ATPase [Deltaproteobacteria bacterium]|jgi:type II secretory pathway predicted ATPase ExeA|nr:peptidoglycan-binding ATPase [Deltaproteobacteria bacterium]